MNRTAAPRRRDAAYVEWCLRRPCVVGRLLATYSLTAWPCSVPDLHTPHCLPRTGHVSICLEHQRALVDWCGPFTAWPRRERLAWIRAEAVRERAIYEAGRAAGP